MASLNCQTKVVSLKLSTSKGYSNLNNAMNNLNAKSFNCQKSTDQKYREIIMKIKLIYGSLLFISLILIFMWLHSNVTFIN